MSLSYEEVGESASHPTLTVVREPQGLEKVEKQKDFSQSRLENHHACFLCASSCSASPPGGNLVDGLPPVVHIGGWVIGGTSGIKTIDS